ncbi:hypothetical protein Vretimale_15853 [Volvox reticuliferus]|uniref:Uncharacterized protein n=1 Tax=Volvox reticuliferus TaxID=1737510 RepID=A0A8J4LW26_9CHLO|nr:hypothetical protein Vretifemale_12910 [Volvox reticuliferus]GIM12523.1 hypothetical protein Vretimale_15853 [Volvox reticuliferus]
MGDPGTFVAVSSTTAKVCCLDADGKPAYLRQESASQPHGSVNWLKNGKAFLTTPGGNVTCIIENEKEKQHIILSLPSGPLLGRVSGDGKCLVLVQSGVPGSINVYDLQSLLGSPGPAKPPVVLQDHDRPILTIAASYCTTHIASSNSTGAVYLHEAGSGVRSTLGALPGGPMLVTPKRCLAFSQIKEPLRLAAGADDGQVIVWQILPMAMGPIVMPIKLRGRVMGVGFAKYKKQQSHLLLACSESGQLVVMDMRHFPNIQGQGQSVSVELSVAVSCMAVRDDGQLVAIGTKDGRVGLIRVEDLTTHGQNVTKLGCIRVFDLGTHLDVVDISFQRPREHRESREPREARENRESRESMPAAPAPAAPVSELPSATQQAPPADAADGSGSQRQSQLEKQDGQATRHAPATSSGAASSAATTASQRQQPASTTSTVGMTGKTATRTTTATSAQPAAPATIPSASATASVAAGSSAAASGPASGQIGPVAMQSLAARNTGVTPVVIPGGHPRRPSDVGGSAVSPGGQAATEEAVVGGDGQMQPSPAGRTLVAGAVASTSSPASSPRPRSPRATMSGGGHPVIRPYSSVGGDNMSAANLRAYLDDFRQEVRDLVRGLQADMVRQAVAAEMAHRNDIALLQQENKILWEEVRRLSQQLDTNLRFGLLSQNGAPWQ